MITTTKKSKWKVREGNERKIRGRKKFSNTKKEKEG